MRQPNHCKVPDRESPAGRRVLVVGLGRFGGGVGVTRWLASQGAIVTVTDQATREELAESVAAIADLPVKLHLGGHDESDLDAVDWVIINPAVNKSASTFFQAVERLGIPWTTEMNLFCERCPAKVIGVTGSYGKSTTCAMLAEALEACRRAGGTSYTGVHLGGNIGRSLLNDLPTIAETDWVVLEMSNAQLEDLPHIQWAPDIAVITNLFPHHLDRYSSFADYANAKFNILRDPKGKNRFIAGELHHEAEKSFRDRIAGCGDRVTRISSIDPPIALRVPGDHNQRNAACALTVCRLLGLNEADVRGALYDFTGLPHRLEFVRTLDGVDYYNDSKSTAPAATVIALQAMIHSPSRESNADRRIVAIVGGQRKVVSLTECANALARYCRVVICMGESGPTFSEALKIAACASSSKPAHSCGGLDSRTDVHIVHGLSDAVRLARRKAKPGDVILFSPAAPSFDQYKNFTERGRHFTELIKAL